MKQIGRAAPVEPFLVSGGDGALCEPLERNPYATVLAIRMAGYCGPVFAVDDGGVGGWPLTDDFPGQVFQFRGEETIPGQLDGIGGPGRGDNELATVDAGCSAGKHGGRAYDFEAQHTENLAKAGKGLFDALTEHVVGGIARGDAGAAVPQQNAGARGGEFVEDGGHLRRFVLNEPVGGDFVAQGGDLFAEPLGVDVGLLRAGVADGDNGDADGAQRLGLFAMFVRAL